MNKEETKRIVREGYAKVAVQQISKKIGYTDEELQAVPEGSNLGLGCGNPTALASLKKGEVVLDLGSGPGFDCFLAADKVGKEGKVIGVDMTPEMLEKARANAAKGNYTNVEFRLGEIENLPVADNSVDVVISNCVINLSPDKESVFKETFRVLKPGGRIMVSDVVLSKELPDFVKNSDEAYVGCFSGATLKDEYLKTIENAGFKEVEIVDEISIPVADWVSDPFAALLAENLGTSTEEAREALGAAASVKVKGVKIN
jgi:SAM-dependent methyltransferase